MIPVYAEEQLRAALVAAVTEGDLPLVADLKAALRRLRRAS